jgi:hypothetical protein
METNGASAGSTSAASGGALSTTTTRSRRRRSGGARSRSRKSGEASAPLPRRKHRVVDVDLSRYLDTIRHDRMLAKVARRVVDGKVMDDNYFCDLQA